MKKLIALFIVASFATVQLNAQTTGIRGTVADTINKKNIANAVVMLLTPGDSILYKFVRTDANGAFALNNVKQGKYVFMITHPLFGEYVDDLDVKGETLDLAKLPVIPKSKLLEEVIIKTGSPIKIKGDTIVYTADSFKVKEGANVEALLKKLPGIQVDKNGKITAMGEEVKKVLVDGEEFFGDDPGIAVKNLRADAVKEVQVFDKKSDQATFTGIDDGEKNKTINLKLKEEKKKGFFGKAELSAGLKDNYNNSAMLNAFKGKRKFATYGIMSNTGQTNLDWQDAQNYGGGSDNMEMGMSDDGGMYMNFTGGDGDDGYWGGRNGIPKNWNGGVHYSNKFPDKTQSFNTAYKFSKVNALGGTTVFAKTYLPDTSWSTNSNSTSFSSKMKHAFNMSYEINLDSMNSIKVTGKYNVNNTRSSNKYYSEAIDQGSKFINNSTRRTNGTSDNSSISGTILWKHKFKKAFRTLSWSADVNHFETDNNNLQYALNNFYTSGNIYQRDTIDQKNIRNIDGLTANTKLSFTEPLAKDFYMELNYTFSVNSNKNDRKSYKGDNVGKYEQLIDSLSNNFTFNKLINKPGISFRLNKKKLSIGVGTQYAINSFIQKNVTRGLRYDYKFDNFVPFANVNLKLKSNKNLRLSYNGSSNAPTVDQLQPIKDNTDPLNIAIGNPDLKQSFNHQISGGYNFYNVLSEKSLWSNFSYNFTDNAFAQYSFIDSLGRRNYKTVNVDGNYNVNVYTSYGFKLKESKIRLGFGPRFSMTRTADFINGIKNISKSKTYGFSFDVSKNVDEKYSFYFSPQFSYTQARATINSAANTDFWSVNGWAEVGVEKLPGKLEFTTGLNFQLRQRDPNFTRNSNYARWNASLERSIYKEKLKASFSVQDILNQNRGYTNNYSSYSFSETYYNTLRRYWMFTLTWNFSNNGAKPAGF